MIQDVRITRDEQDDARATRLDADGLVDLTRSLCPHPQVAVYDGTGNPTEADSFVCEVP